MQIQGTKMMAEVCKKNFFFQKKNGIEIFHIFSALSLFNVVKFKNDPCPSTSTLTRYSKQRQKFVKKLFLKNF